MKAMRPPNAWSGGGAPRRMSATYQAATGSAMRLRASATAIVEARAQGGHVAAAGEARIETGQVLERDAEAAEADRKAGRGLLGQGDLGPRLFQAGEEARHADVRQEFDGWHVEGHLQRPPRRDGALE